MDALIFLYLHQNTLMQRLYIMLNTVVSKNRRKFPF